MDIIVAGSRNFTDRDFLFKKLDLLTSKLSRVRIITGGAKGADRLAQDWAFSRGHTVVNYHADWDRHGKAAGPIRNEEMAQVGESLVAFHLDNSPGTADMIRRARRHGLKVRVYEFQT